MRKILKTFVLVSVAFMLTANAWALPVGVAPVSEPANLLLLGAGLLGLAGLGRKKLK